jgi:hypothetical protein
MRGALGRHLDDLALDELNAGFGGKRAGRDEPVIFFSGPLLGPYAHGHPLYAAVS